MVEKSSFTKHRYHCSPNSWFLNPKTINSDQFLDDPILSESSLLAFKSQSLKRLGEDSFSHHLSVLWECLLSNFRNRTDWIWREKSHLILCISSASGKALRLILAIVCEGRGPTTVTPLADSTSDSQSHLGGGTGTPDPGGHKSPLCS